MNKTIGELVTRNTKLESAEGTKKILVFGVMTVPASSTLGENNIVHVRNDFSIDVENVMKAPKEMAFWDAPDTCQEVFGLESMREKTEMELADKALALIKDGKYEDPELQEIAKKLETAAKDMPVFDTMKQVMEAVVKTVETRTKQF